MSAKRWDELTPRGRKLIVAGAVAESVLKAIALADLARRPAAEVRGPKPLWAAFLTLFNSVGAGPVIYWLFGRRKTV